jgi:selenocysteine lyase/cysteine desulfurase
MNPGRAPLAELLGADELVPIYGGGATHYVNLDYAATTPPLRRVWDRLAEIMPLYGSVHRGSGFKSVISTRLFESSLHRILAFSDGCPEQDVLVLSWNTTSSINLLARRLGLTKDSVVVTSEQEHTSNLLPWRKHARAVECHTEVDGTLDFNHLEDLLNSR